MTFESAQPKEYQAGGLSVWPKRLMAHRASRLKLIPTMAKECRKYGISLVPEPEFRRFYEILHDSPKTDRGLQPLIARLEELPDYGFFEVGAIRENLWRADELIALSARRQLFLAH